VDEITSKDLPIHHLCDAAGLVIVENLDLRAVAPGVYELIACRSASRRRRLAAPRRAPQLA